MALRDLHLWRDPLTLSLAALVWPHPQPQIWTTSGNQASSYWPKSYAIIIAVAIVLGFWR